MVAFLKKPQGSEDFHQIVDFLNGSYIRYALTENPTIYVSPINQFWRTASTRTLDNGEIEINATVDGQDKTITEASVRRHLKLADADGISTLPTTEIFEQLALMGSVHARPEGKVTSIGNELSSTKDVHNKALITLTKRVKKLEKKLKLKRRSAVVDSSEDEEASLHNEDSSKQGRMIEEIDEDENVNLVKSKSEPPKKLKKKEMIQIGHDEELAQKLHAEELVKDTARQEQERYHAVQNRSFSIAEVRKNMCIYLKNQGGYKQSHFKGMSYEDIRPIFERLKSLIVSWKSYCKEDVGYYEIHRADGSYKTYMFFSEMLNDFDREDLIVLYRLFNEKYASTRPGFDDLMLWGDMKIMFEPNDDDAVWKNHHSQELIEWKLYDSCGVHSLMLGEVSIHMLVEKKYPLPQDTLMRMLQWKLHVNYNVTEMAYELLRFIRSQLNQ
ncbi:hypothetical protein Tco_1151203 [Tanacetum coccineum]